MVDIIVLIAVSSLVGSSFRNLLRKKDVGKEFYLSIVIALIFAGIAYFLNYYSYSPDVCTSFYGQPCTSNLLFETTSMSQNVGISYFFFISGYVASDLLDSFIFLLLWRRKK